MIKNRANAEHYQWGDQCDGWRLLDKPDLSVIEERMPPGTSELRHYHERARQVFVVLHGALSIEREAQRFELRVGDSLEVPPAEPHRVWNDRDVDAVFLVVSAPTTRGDRKTVE